MLTFYLAFEIILTNMSQPRRAIWVLAGAIAACVGIILGSALRILGQPLLKDFTPFEKAGILVTLSVFLVGVTTSVIASTMRNLDFIIGDWIQLRKEQKLKLKAAPASITLEVRDKDGGVLATGIDPANVQEIAKVVEGAKSAAH